MVRVYISYDAEGGLEAPQDAAEQLAAAGYNPFVPLPLHRRQRPNAEKHGDWKGKPGCHLDWLALCDALLLLPGWSRCSEGLEEMQYAEDAGIPFFTTAEALGRRFPPDVGLTALELSEIILEPQLICD